MVRPVVPIGHERSASKTQHAFDRVNQKRARHVAPGLDSSNRPSRDASLCGKPLLGQAPLPADGAQPRAEVGGHRLAWKQQIGTCPHQVVVSPPLSVLR